MCDIRVTTRLVYGDDTCYILDYNNNEYSIINRYINLAGTWIQLQLCYSTGMAEHFSKFGGGEAD